MKDELLLAKNALSKLSNKTGESRIRFELFSILNIVILSKDLFPKNKDIQPFLINCNINFKEYVFASRTSVIARVSRTIANADYDQLKLILTETKKLIFIDHPTYKATSNNGIDDLLNRFSRK